MLVTPTVVSIQWQWFFLSKRWKCLLGQAGVVQSKPRRYKNKMSHFFFNITSFVLITSYVLTRLFLLTILLLLLMNTLTINKTVIIETKISRWMEKAFKTCQVEFSGHFCHTVKCRQTYFQLSKLCCWFLPTGLEQEIDMCYCYHLAKPSRKKKKISPFLMKW